MKKDVTFVHEALVALAIVWMDGRATSREVMEATRGEIFIMHIICSIYDIIYDKDINDKILSLYIMIKFYHMMGICIPWLLPWHISMIVTEWYHHIRKKHNIYLLPGCFHDITVCSCYGNTWCIFLPWLLPWHNNMFILWKYVLHISPLDASST